MTGLESDRPVHLVAGEPLVSQFHYAIKSAILAPSIHNTQPWRFLIEEQAICLCADWGRRLPVVDPYGRQLIISCGAALMNLRIALARLGHGVEIDVSPYRADDTVLARLRISSRLAAETSLADLFPAIAQRVTNRHGFASEAIAADLQAKLAAAAHREGASAMLVDEKGLRLRIADLVAQGDQAQFADPRFRHELAEWTHYRRSDDGMPQPADSLRSLLDLETPLLSGAIRTFNVVGAVAASDEELAEGSPLLACLSTDNDERESWLATGQALQALLLTATQQGLSASFLNQPIEVDYLRPRLRELLSIDSWPQILLRIGHGQPQPRSLRRPVSDVL